MPAPGANVALGSAPGNDSLQVTIQIVTGGPRVTDGRVASPQSLLTYDPPSSCPVMMTAHLRLSSTTYPPAIAGARHTPARLGLARNLVERWVKAAQTPLRTSSTAATVVDNSSLVGRLSSSAVFPAAWGRVDRFGSRRHRRHRRRGLCCKIGPMQMASSGATYPVCVWGGGAVGGCHWCHANSACCGVDHRDFDLGYIVCFITLAPCHALFLSSSIPNPAPPRPPRPPCRRRWRRRAHVELQKVGGAVKFSGSFVAWFAWVPTVPHSAIQFSQRYRRRRGHSKPPGVPQNVPPGLTLRTGENDPFGHSGSGVAPVLQNMKSVCEGRQGKRESNTLEQSPTSLAEGFRALADVSSTKGPIQKA